MTWIPEEEALRLTGMTKAELHRRELAGEIRTADPVKVMWAEWVLDFLLSEPGPFSDEEEKFIARLMADPNNCTWHEIALVMGEAIRDHFPPELQPYEK